ncbi:MAG: hypothetical protein Q8N56_03265 [bacterium]|nr:hypothetical protein [bacterium]
MENTNSSEQKPAAASAGEQKKEKNIGMAIVAYILFFVPLLTDAKNDPFVKYHVKQGLVLFLGWVIACAFSFIPLSGWFVGRLLYFGLFILLIIGILNAANSRQAPLPLIGKFADKFNF